MCATQLAQAPRAERGETEPYNAVIARVDLSVYEAGGLGAINEPDRAVMTQQQGLGHGTDGRSLRSWVPADGEQQLMLRGGQARRFRLLLAPMQELAQTGSEREETLVVGVVRFSGKPRTE